MYIGRTMNELETTPLKDWKLEELAYYQKTMKEVEDMLNRRGNDIYQKIIEEINQRGGLPKNSGDWDHSSEIIYD